MNVPEIILFCLLVLGLGWLVIRLLFPVRGWSCLTLHAGLCYLSGIAILSATVTTMSLLGMPLTALSLGLGLTGWSVLLGAVGLGVRAPRQLLPRYVPPRRSFERLVGSVLVVAAGFAIVCAIVQSQNLEAAAPHGHWDGVAIWNYHARIIYHAGVHAVATGASWSHVDYPLLLPAATAGGWTLLGRTDPAVPQLIACGFMVACFLVLHGILTLAQRPWHGLLAVIVLAATRGFIFESAAQQADVPLAAYMLSAVGCASLSLILPAGRGRWLALAGLNAAAAAWTKNEGLPFFLIMAATTVMALFFSYGTRDAGKSLLRFGAGAVLILALLISFKLVNKSPNDVFSEQNGHSRAKLVDIPRHLQILGALRDQLFLRTRSSEEQFAEMGRWARPNRIWVINLPAILLAVVALCGVRLPRPKASWGIGGMVLLGMALSYYLVYVLTPRPLWWHLQTSLSRLLVQLWPLALLAIMLALRMPAFVKPIAAEPAKPA